MPTNVPPQYREAEARYRAARTPEDKLAALEEMLRIMPKHKGTDKLQADVKARIAKLHQQQEGSRRGGGGRSHVIAREGAGQVALAGPPNGGKSSLVAALTGAEPKVADYPYTTLEPVPGMMPHEDVFLQLIDLPAISTEHVEPWVYDLVRHADLLWIVVESGGALDGLEATLSLLAAKHIETYPLGTPAGEGDPTWVRKAGILVVTGMDKPGSADNLEILRALIEAPWPILAVSPVNGHGLEELGRRTYEALDVIRIYTKEPGKPPDRVRPFTLPRGATVADLAETIHRELAQGFKFARLWGEGVFDGQQVQRDHVLQEGNVVELHLM